MPIIQSDEEQVSNTDLTSLTATLWDSQLIQKYNASGPRYTSYPTALQFSDSFNGEACLVDIADQQDAARPLSLYIHIPFCAQICYYCGCNKVVTHHRERASDYLSILHREIEFQCSHIDIARPVKQLHWGGGTPTFISDEETRQLIALLKSRFNLLDDDSGDYSIEIDPRECSRDKLQLLRDEGFNRVSLGVQDINPEVQAAVNRIQPFSQVEQLVKNAREMAFKSINVDLIYGLPLQTAQSFRNTVEKLIDLSPDRLSIFNYAHLPERFKAQRLINSEDLPGAQEKLIILQQTIELLTQAGYTYIGMDHFAKPDDDLAIAQRAGKLHRNFQGYTTHGDCDLIAFGVSSISQVGNYIYQNTPKLKDYESAVNNGKSPLIRGVTLTEDDRIRAAVIIQLICHFTLHKSTIEADHGIKFNHYFAKELERLEGFATDGLIELSPTTLRVTTKGRLLIRSICMQFDAYLSRQAKTKAFSRII